jgi:hypothetical protein
MSAKKYFYPKEPGVYRITHGNKSYVGYTKNLQQRIGVHFQKLNRGCHENYKLQAEWNTDCNDWKVEILELTTDKEREIYWTKFYNCQETGFNLNLGRHLGEEHRNAVGNAHRNKQLSTEQKSKISDSLKGRIPWNKGMKLNEHSNNC